MAFSDPRATPDEPVKTLARASWPAGSDESGGFGGRLRVLRLRRGLSSRALAARSGVSATAIRRIERGQRQPRATTLCALAGAFNVEFRIRAHRIEIIDADHTVTEPGQPADRSAQRD